MSNQTQLPQNIDPDVDFKLNSEFLSERHQVFMSTRPPLPHTYTLLSDWLLFHSSPCPLPATANRYAAARFCWCPHKHTHTQTQSSIHSHSHIASADQQQNQTFTNVFWMRSRSWSDDERHDDSGNHHRNYQRSGI